MREYSAQTIDFKNDSLLSFSAPSQLDVGFITGSESEIMTELPKPVKRSYPAQYVKLWKTKIGETVTIRPIRQDDEAMMVKFHETLSEQTVYLRYFHLMKLSRRVSHERLERICAIDYENEMVLVAEHKNRKTKEREIIAVGRLNKLLTSNVAEIAIIVSDCYHGLGLGTEILRRLVQIGRDKKLDSIVADILPYNRAVQGIFRKLDFSIHYEIEEGVVKAEIDLNGRIAS